MHDDRWVCSRKSNDSAGEHDFLVSRARTPASFPACIPQGGIDTRTIGRSSDWPNGLLNDIHFIADDPNETSAND
jgi:hypothetical protein